MDKKKGWRGAGTRPEQFAAALLADSCRMERRALRLIDALDDLALGELRDRLDSMGEMSELDQVRMQMMMDRVSKAMETLSNMLKKSSDTADAIIRKLK